MAYFYAVRFYWNHMHGGANGSRQNITHCGEFKNKSKLYGLKSRAALHRLIFLNELIATAAMLI